MLRWIASDADPSSSALDRSTLPADVTATCDPDGRAAFERLASGDWRIAVARAAAPSPAVPLAPRPATLRVEPGRVAELQVAVAE